jgi:Glycosyl transferase family 2
MAAPPGVSVVLPVRNQADHIVDVVDSYVGALSQLERTFEIIIVENESEDGSLRLCLELARRHSVVSVIQNERRGFGRAVRAGLAAARADTLCYTNCAYTTPLTLKNAIELFVVNDGPERLVNTVREMRYPFARRFGSALFNAECRALFGFRTKDVNGTPKVFSRALFDRFALLETESLFDVEIFIQSQLRGARVVEMPVLFTPRFGGKSATTMRLALRLYTGAFMMWLNLRSTRRRLGS